MRNRDQRSLKMSTHNLFDALLLVNQIFRWSLIINFATITTRNMHKEGPLLAHPYSNHYVFESVAHTQWIDDLFLVLVSNLHPILHFSLFFSKCSCVCGFIASFAQVSLSNVQCKNIGHILIWKKKSWIDRRIILRSGARPKHVRNYFNCFDMSILLWSQLRP